jgi:hypothetical protein
LLSGVFILQPAESGKCFYSIPVATPKVQQPHSQSSEEPAVVFNEQPATGNLQLPPLYEL